ncbi:tetratricopeptide repeat protein [Aestuariivita boseongensis]|uniref:tetratricopeptide repeat protein n=1 Tax=Aestuariivita boseongensis TaxID=1470562 RepID=UPI0006813CD0|nr:tetratricopeptide repeat protein [Aestuariivita boseongensis]
MTRLPFNLKCIVAAVLLTVTFSLPAAAQSEEERTLLADLAQAEPAAALRIDRELQAIWTKSGSSSMDLLLRRGREALEEGETRIAIEHLTALTDHAPDFAEGWHLRAQAFYAENLFGPAVADLERALALNPYNYNAIFGLGAILEQFGDEKRAFEAYSRVKTMHPHHEEVDSALERLESRVGGTSL